MSKDCKVVKTFKDLSVKDVFLFKNDYNESLKTKISNTAWVFTYEQDPSERPYEFEMSDINYPVILPGYIQYKKDIKKKPHPL